MLIDFVSTLYKIHITMNHGVEPNTALITKTYIIHQAAAFSAI
jgi:hypothetical protein